MIEHQKALTINFWAKNDGSWYSSDNITLVGCSFRGWSLEIQNNQKWCFHLQSFSTSSGYVGLNHIIDLPNLPENEWVMFTIVIDNTNNDNKTRIKTYINN
jgi:hypothetical protein